MSVKAVIFDLDGVIVSTDELHYQGWKTLADREGIEFDRTINNRLRGVSRMASLEIILEKASKSYSDEGKAEMCEYKNNVYVKLLDGLTSGDILGRADEVLKVLHENGIALAIGSSSKNTKKILTQIGLIDKFDAIADGTDITHSKPNPEVFLCAAKKLGIEPEYCVVVEDAVAGIQAAKAAGMTACAVGDAKSSDLPDHKLGSLNDLIEIVCGK